VAVGKAEKLILENGVQFITGTISSSSALAVREVINERGVFFNPTVGANEVTTLSEECSSYLFRTELMTWQAVSALVNMVKQLVDAGELGNRTWLVIPGYAYGFSMRDSWREMTQDFVSEVGYSEETGFGFTDHSAIITEIQAAQAAGEVDFITTALLGSPLVTFMQQAADAGLILPATGGLPVVDPILQFNVREIGDIAVGHYTTIRYSLLYDSPENQAFVQAFNARWGDFPENFAHNAYVAVKMMAEGIKIAQSTDPDGLIPVLEGLHYPAPMGLSYFRSVDHQIVRDVGAGKLVKVGDYAFPVEQQLGEMIDGEDAISGIEMMCNLGV
jgi:branched-chain amino acid transport system substrate-binding protein